MEKLKKILFCIASSSVVAIAASILVTLIVAKVVPMTGTVMCLIAAMLFLLFFSVILFGLCMTFAIEEDKIDQNEQQKFVEEYEDDITQP